MTLRLTSAKRNVVLGVYLPGMDRLEGAQNVKGWSGVLPKTGDYGMMVFPEDQVTDTAFMLEVTIR